MRKSSRVATRTRTLEPRQDPSRSPQVRADPRVVKDMGRPARTLLTVLVLLAALAAPAAASTTDTLVFQHRLADDVGFANAPWVGTHNSFNSVAEMGPTLS